MAGAFFLQMSCLLRVALMWDHNHRAWNDLQAALQSAGLWTIVLLWGIVFSMNFGPYDTGDWWRKSQEAAREYSSSAQQDCPLLQHLLPRIAEEADCSHRLMEADYAREVASNLWDSKAFSQKGPRLAMSRWFSWFEC